MLFDFAPLEGITGSAFRRTHASCFSGVDRYWAPFLAPDGSGRCKLSALEDLRPEHNPEHLPVPQILCNKAESFLSAASELRSMGYTEVNLNTGCPSGTVVPKHKGAGMLTDLVFMDRFLYDIFSECPLKISVKTRLGLDSSSEFPAILDVFRKYPLSELVIHARDRKGMYRSEPDIIVFSEAFFRCSFPVRYNGSIIDRDSLHRVLKAVPQLDRVMVGRAAVADPALFRCLHEGPRLQADELLDYLRRYEAELSESGLSEHFILARLKELWYYTSSLFSGDPRGVKRLLKAQTLYDYRDAVSALFSGTGFRNDRAFHE